MDKMVIPPLLTHVTTDDPIRSGACVDGVAEWRNKNAPLTTQVPVSIALEIATPDIKSHIKKAAGLSGSVYGSGDGYGSGYGDGSAYGGGYGYVEGSGYGYGDDSGGGSV